MLMLKSIGIIIIILIGAFWGLRLSAKLQIRKSKLNGFYVFIREISDRIKTGEELEVILNSKTSQGLIKTDEYKVDLEEGLNSEDKKLLNEFFSMLGMGDTASQISRCEVYNELLNKRLKEAEQEAKEKGKLYSTLGVFSGIFVAILFI